MGLIVVIVDLQMKGKFNYRIIKFCWVNERRFTRRLWLASDFMCYPLMVTYDDAVLQGLIVVIVDLMFLSD